MAGFDEAVDLFKIICKEPTEQKSYRIYATVTSINPIAIHVEGFDADIPSELIELGAMCRRYVLPIPHKHTGCYHPLTGYETEEIEVWRGLQVGDRVVCFRFNNGQLYYIAQRVEMEGFRE